MSSYCMCLTRPSGIRLIVIRWSPHRDSKIMVYIIRNRGEQRTVSGNSVSVVVMILPVDFPRGDNYNTVAIIVRNNKL